MSPLYLPQEALVYPAETQVDLINPLKTAPWNMNDSCRALLADGRSCDPPPPPPPAPGQSPLRPAAHRAKSVETKKTQHGAREWICACNKTYVLSLKKFEGKKSRGVESKRLIERDKKKKKNVPRSCESSFCWTVDLDNSLRASLRSAPARSPLPV